MNPNKPGSDVNAANGEVRARWGWLLAFGILSMILGFIGLGATFALSVASAFLFGVLLVLGSIGQAIACFKEKALKGKLWHAMVSLLYMVAGIALLQNPLEGSILLTAVLGGALVGAGIFRILMALSSRQEKGWIWPILSGVVTLMLGGIIISQWPVSGLWVIGMLIAVDLIVSGWGYVALALAVGTKPRN